MSPEALAGGAVERTHEGLVLRALYPLGSSVPALRRVPVPVRRATRRTLTATAVRAHLARCRRTRLVAITGSRGKTTLKDLTAAMLSAAGPTVRTPHNDNGLYGVPSSLLAIRPSDDFAVIEVGVAGPGDMAWMSGLVRPGVAVLTGIGVDHLSAFGDRAALAAEKRLLLERVGPGGTVVVNADDDVARATAEGLRARIVLAGTAADADVRLVDAEPDWPRGQRLRVVAHGEEVTIEAALHGRHLAPLAALALATAVAAGADARTAASGAPRFEPPPGRMRPEPGPNGSMLLLDDAKSRLPIAEAAIRALGDAPARRRIAVLGEVQEAPQTEATYGPLAALLRDRADVVVAVGRAADPYAALLRDSGVEVRTAPGVVEAAAALDGDLREGDVLLLHGANPQHLQRVQLLLEGREIACTVKRCRLAWRCTACPWLTQGPPPHMVAAA